MEDISFFNQDLNRLLWSSPVGTIGHEFSGVVVDAGPAAVENGETLGNGSGAADSGGEEHHQKKHDRKETKRKAAHESLLHREPSPGSFAVELWGIPSYSTELRRGNLPFPEFFVENSGKQS